MNGMLLRHARVFFVSLLACFSCGMLAAQDFPKASISNGVIRAELMLPDAKKGSYRGTRFDWPESFPAFNSRATNISDAGMSIMIRISMMRLRGRLRNFEPTTQVLATTKPSRAVLFLASA